MNIKDGRGSGHEVAVNKMGQIATDGDGITRDSLNIGGNYVFIVDDVDVNVDDTLLMVRNDTDKPFAIDKVELEGGDVASEYWFLVQTTPFAAAGTAVVPFNLNTHSGQNRKSGLTAFGDETVNSGGTVIHRQEIAAATNANFKPTGLILGQGVALAVDQKTESTLGKVAIWGHYIA